MSDEPSFEGMLHGHYGYGLRGHGAPLIATEVERVIDDRPCEPFTEADSDWPIADVAGPGNGLTLYTGSSELDDGEGSIGPVVDGSWWCSPPERQQRVREFEALLTGHLRGGPLGAESQSPQQLQTTLTPVYSMPSSWWQHLKWTLQRRWPRVFGWVSVYWTQSWRR